MNTSPQVKMLSSMGTHKNVVGFLGMFICGAHPDFASNPASSVDPAIALECLGGKSISTIKSQYLKILGVTFGDKCPQNGFKNSLRACGAHPDFASNPASSVDPAIALECLGGTTLSLYI